MHPYALKHQGPGPSHLLSPAGVDKGAPPFGSPGALLGTTESSSQCLLPARGLGLCWHTSDHRMCVPVCVCVSECVCMCAHKGPQKRGQDLKSEG
jgi:hypothetical protein